MKKIYSFFVMAVVLTAMCFAGSSNVKGEIKAEAKEYDYVVAQYLEEDGSWNSDINSRIKDALSVSRYKVVTDVHEIEDYDTAKIMIITYEYEYNSNTATSTLKVVFYDYKLAAQKKAKKVKLATYTAKSNIGEPEESLTYCFDKVFEYITKDFSDNE